MTSWRFRRFRLFLPANRLTEPRRSDLPRRMRLGAHYIKLHSCARVGGRTCGRPLVRQAPLRRPPLPSRQWLPGALGVTACGPRAAPSLAVTSRLQRGGGATSLPSSMSESGLAFSCVQDANPEAKASPGSARISPTRGGGRGDIRAPAAS